MGARRDRRAWAGALTLALAIAVSATAAGGPVAPAQAGASAGAGFHVLPDVEYRRVTGMTLTMDVYVPNTGGPFPAVELVHGGGFTRGTPRFMKGLAKFLVLNGYVAFNIAYRLAPRFPYPAAVQDAESAIGFIRAQAATYHVDPQRVGALGTSAGGTIAASVATETTGPLSGGDRVAALVTWSSVFDFRPTFSNPRTIAYVCGGETASCGQSSPKAAQASPITHLSCDDPPAFVANSHMDAIPLDQATMWVAALEKHGIAHELLTPSSGHALKYASVAKPPTLAFLDRYLKEAPASQRCQASASPTSSPTPSTSHDASPSVSPPRGGAQPTDWWLAIGAGLVALLATATFAVRRARRR